MGKTFKCYYTGHGYPSVSEIEKKAKAEGFTHSYWASDESIFFKGFYNGDTVVVYNSTEDMDEGMRHDALKYGKPIVKGDNHDKDYK